MDFFLRNLKLQLWRSLVAKKKNYTIAILLVSRRGQHTTRFQWFPGLMGGLSPSSSSCPCVRYCDCTSSSLFPVSCFTSNGVRVSLSGWRPTQRDVSWTRSPVVVFQGRPPRPVKVITLPRPQTASLLCPLGLCLPRPPPPLHSSSPIFPLSLSFSSPKSCWTYVDVSSSTLNRIADADQKPVTCLGSYLSSAPSRVERHHEEIQS